MKKSISFILCCLLALSATGCAALWGAFPEPGAPSDWQSWTEGNTPGGGIGDGTSQPSDEVPDQVKQDLSQLDASDYSGSFGSYTTLIEPTSGVPVMDVVLPSVRPGILFNVH